MQIKGQALTRDAVIDYEPLVLQKDLRNEEQSDKYHGVPNVPTKSITRFKVKKIQQAFILHVQNWTCSVKPPFHLLQANPIEEQPFKAS